MLFWENFMLQNFMPQFIRLEGDGSGGGGDAGDPGTGDPGTGDKGAGASGKFIEKVDPVTKQKIKVPAEMETYLGHMISTTRASIEGQFKPLLEKLQSENAEFEEVKAEYDKLKEASMTAEERAQENARKVIMDHEKKVKIAVEESRVWKSRFENVTKHNDILSSFGDIKLCNPSQTAVLFEHEGRAKISERVDGQGQPTGEFETRMTLTLEDANGVPETVEGTPAELFKKWISLERNYHHVQNDLLPGAGARQTSGKGMSSDFSSLTPVERMKKAREHS